MNKIYYYIKSFLKYSPLGLGAFWGLVVLAFHTSAQKWYAPTQKELSTGVYLSTSGQNPFWLRSNQYGIVPLESQFVTFRGGIYKEYKSDRLRQAQPDNNTVNLLPVGRHGSSSKGNSSNEVGLRQAQPDIRQAGTQLSGTRLSQPDNTNAVPLSLSKGNSNAKNKFDYGYGLSAVANLGKVNQVLLPEAYLKVKYGAFEIYGGRRKEIVGLVDTTLSSGSFIWSGNALPIPKVQLSIPNYTSILGKGLISIKGAYAHGWFDNKGVIQSYKLHQKWLYGRIGRDKSKFHLYGGFNHQVQWGGYNSLTKKEYADNIYAYLYSILPLKKVGAKAAQNLTQSDLENRVGNQLGSIDVAFDTKIKGTTLFIYRQNLYEQGAALLRLANIQDGLNGLKLTFKKPQSTFYLSQLTAEFFYSMNQGKTPILFTKEVGWELENYFTHYQYNDGWSYQRKIIGTPFITTENETLTQLPNSKFFINNNRIKAFYLSSRFNYTNKHIFTIKTALTFNNGILINRQPALLPTEIYKQTTIFAEWQRLLSSSSTFNLQFGVDRGQLFTNSLGIAFSYSKSF